MKVRQVGVGIGLSVVIAACAGKVGESSLDEPNAKDASPSDDPPAQPTNESKDASTTAKDASASADATPENTKDASEPLSDASGVEHAGSAITFAQGTCVDLGSLPIPANFTFEAWINPSAASVGTEMEIVSKDLAGQSDNQFRFGMLHTGELFFMASDAAGDANAFFTTAYTLKSPTAMPLGVWTHVAVTRSGTTYSLIVGDKTVATKTVTGTFNGGTNAFRIGGRMTNMWNVAADTFVGTIDEVRAWSYARTPGAIIADADHAIDETNPDYAKLLAGWRLNEDFGVITVDVKVTYAGALIGTPTWVPSTAY